jgi:hypothetical protein
MKSTQRYPLIDVAHPATAIDVSRSADLPSVDVADGTSGDG